MKIKLTELDATAVECQSMVVTPKNFDETGNRIAITNEDGTTLICYLSIINTNGVISVEIIN